VRGDLRNPLAGILVAALLAVAACAPAPVERSGTSAEPQANPPAASPSSTAPTPGSGSAAGAAGGGSAPASGGGAQAAGGPCRSSQLAVKLVDATRGSAGWSDWLFELRNTSVTPCVMAGYPTVQLLDAAHQPLATLEERGAGPALTGRMPASVAVPAGGAAVFGIETYRCVGSVRAQAPAANLLVTPPGESVPLAVTVDPAITSCSDGRFVASPVRSDPSGVAT
jgi:hypothetical protein